MKNLNFKKIKEWLQGLDYRHYINAVLTIGFVALGIFVFPNAICRLAESIRDFGLSCAYYFCEIIFEFNPITPSVNSFPTWEITPSFFQPLTLLPVSWEEFQVLWGTYWQNFIQSETLTGYFYALGDVLYYVSQVVLILIPFVLCAYMFFQKYFKTTNNDYDVESTALRRIKRIADFTYIPIKKWIREYIWFMKENAFWGKLWAWIWAFYFNIITIVVEFIAFYLYFIVSFDFVNIYRQVYKLLLDLSPMVRFIPVAAWVVIIIIALELAARHIGYNELEHRERKNGGFLEERGVMTIVYGPMGAGKTKTITDMALTQEVRFRDMAFEIIIENRYGRNTFLAMIEK